MFAFEEKNEEREIGNLELAKKSLKNVGEIKVIVEQDLKKKNDKEMLLILLSFL